MNYNRRPVNRRFFISCCASLLILIPAKGVLADGAYQRTEDRKKTFVWNNDPKPGDAASWSGDRDSEGYATGPGTLTWYRTQHAFMTGSNLPGSKKTPISSYTGTMVRGKLSGNVTTVDHGKSYHATFADGHRKGSWVAGPLITKAERVEEAAAPEFSPHICSRSPILFRWLSMLRLQRARFFPGRQLLRRVGPL